MVHRIYVEKRPGLSPEAGSLLADLRGFLGIRSLAGVRVLNRYDVENIDPEVYERAKAVVFSEPQVDVIYDETFPQPRNAHSVLAVEALPGQFDQRADSCAQCIQLMAGVERPLVRLRQGLPAGGGAEPGGAGEDPRLPHQPRGEPGGLPGEAGDPGPDLRRAPPWWRP